jgi:transposase-like protein
MAHTDEATASSSSKAMTERQYVRSKGLRCPFCKSSDIEGTGVDVDAGFATQDIRCNDCERCWTDHYRLSGYQAAPE